MDHAVLLRIHDDDGDSRLLVTGNRVDGYSVRDFVDASDTVQVVAVADIAEANATANVD